MAAKRRRAATGRSKERVAPGAPGSGRPVRPGKIELAAIFAQVVGLPAGRTFEQFGLAAEFEAFVKLAGRGYMLITARERSRREQEKLRGQMDWWAKHDKDVRRYWLVNAVQERQEDLQAWLQKPRKKSERNKELKRQAALLMIRARMIDVAFKKLKLRFVALQLDELVSAPPQGKRKAVLRGPARCAAALSIEARALGDGPGKARAGKKRDGSDEWIQTPKTAQATVTSCFTTAVGEVKDQLQKKAESLESAKRSQGATVTPNAKSSTNRRRPAT